MSFWLTSPVTRALAIHVPDKNKQDRFLRKRRKL
jgi:hypothetical protein